MPSTVHNTATVPAPLPSEYPPPRKISQGSYPTRALGILLDEDCLIRWGTIFYEQVYPGELSTMSAERAREAVLAIRSATLSEIPQVVYDAFPNMPRLRRNTILMDDVAGTWLLVFKDNSSHACLHAYLDPEDVKGAKKLLGLERRGTKWYDVFL